MDQDDRSTEPAIAVIADLVGPKAASNTATAWLDELGGILNEHFEARGTLVAEFVRARGDELEGLVSLAADPFDAYLFGALGYRAGTAVLPTRWAIVAGAVRPGSGPADRRDGLAIWQAQDLIPSLRSQGDYALVMRSSAPQPDANLGKLIPWIHEGVADLTDNQRHLLAHRMRAGDTTLTLERLRLGARVDVSLEAVRKTLASTKVRRLDDLIAVARAEFARGIGDDAPGLRAQGR
jgi:hypothetical protein